ncbi:hypothetical protein APSETT445_005183 [Aspergillus pseudonomiae]
MSLQTPRVLPAHLHAFHPSNANPHVTNTVRLLGTVTALRGDTATITCGDNGDVTLILKPDSHLQMGKLVEVVGKVTDVEGQGARADGGSWPDYKIYENVVNATHRFKSLFYEAAE